ncbi:hypothetical protein PSE10B_55640 [Pseudomonas amygdali pv. eriobotryae]|nr:hypothetical protein [Pseudomonas amygdali]GFZ69042.1 hypothetical protein PSE10B_55640 [Pseudomonas amygdali pv. eriobotryae]
MANLKYLYDFDGAVEIIEKEVLYISSDMVLTQSYDGLTVDYILKRDDNGVVVEWRGVVGTHLFPEKVNGGIDLQAIKDMSLLEFFLHLANLSTKKA